MIKVLALDFDGVLWDSAGECFETGVRAYAELEGRAVDPEVTKAAFIKGRPLARTGHDFYLLLKLLEEEPGRDLGAYSYQDFVSYRDQYAEEARSFDKIFYRLRAHYRDSKPEEWVSWQGAYPEMLALLERIEGHVSRLALATTKDTASAKKLLGITGREWPIFGKEFSEHKADQITGIAKHFEVDTSEILFVDDLLENLEQVVPTGAEVALAAWGYNTADSRRLCQSKNYPVLSVDELGERLLGLREERVS